MAKLAYDAECICKGKITTVIKKPTRMEHSVAKVRCEKCGSRYLIVCFVDQTSPGRQFKTDVENIYLSEEAKALRQKSLDEHDKVPEPAA